MGNSSEAVTTRHHHLEVISKGRPDASKTPLLFVHGAWHAAWCWDQGFLDRMAEQGFEAHAVSLRGHGGSTGQERLRTTRMQDYVDDVNLVIDRMPRPPVVIGHSMGGFVVQKLLERRQLPGAVLMASVPPGGVAALLFKLIRKDPVGVLLSNLTLRLTPLVSTPERVKALFFSEEAAPDDVDRLAAALGDEAFAAYIDMLFADLCQPSHSTPVLVLGARNDALFSVETTQKIADAYRTQAILFDEMGHDMMLEHGWKDVADMIRDWVRVIERPQPRIAA